MHKIALAHSVTYFAKTGYWFTMV